MCRSLSLLSCLLLVCSGALAGSVSAGEPLHQRIDQLIAAGADGPLGEPTSDAEFLRRVWLDLAGTIPTTSQAQAFFNDSSPDKRRKLIDQLLAAETYARHMQDLWDVTLLERRGDEGPWREWLLRSFAENKPWDQLVREMLNPDAEDEATRDSAMFIHKHLQSYGQNPNDMPGLIRDVGRLMLGKDIQCAQCHDHPFVDDYTQRDYQGLMAFLGHVNMRRDLDFPAVYEAPLKAALTYESVFVPGKEMVGPRLPGGEEREVPMLKGDELFSVPANKETKAPGVPSFRTLPILAAEMTRKDHRQFNRTIANRLWFIMMGRGLVHPLDMDHPGNPASHPELLDLLTEEIAAHDYDIKWLLRELALSATYQRSSRLPAGVTTAPADRFRYALEKPISADTLMWSMLTATGAIAQVPAAKLASPTGDESDKEKAKATSKEDKPASKTAEAKGDETVETTGKLIDLPELRKQFLAAFANPPTEPELEFNATVRAALFVLNDDAILGWLEPRSGNLVDRLTKLTNDDEVAERLYLAILSRPPDDEERRQVVEFLKDQPDRGKVIGQLGWALLAGTEFALNH